MTRRELMMGTTSRAVPILFVLAATGFLALPGCEEECNCGAGYRCVRGECIPIDRDDAAGDVDTLPDPDADADVEPDFVDDDAPAPEADVDFEPDRPQDVVSELPEVGPEPEACNCAEIDCTSTNPCQVGRCSPIDCSCIYDSVMNGTPCPDGLWCNGNEVCHEGVCSAAARGPCDDGESDPCVISVTCNEATRTCERHVRPDGSDCNDGFYCNGPDSCVGGECTPAGSPCPISTGNPCTRWECSETARCFEAPAPAGDSCFFNSCTLFAQCNAAGDCVQTSHLCADATPCTTDRCAMIGGVCVPVADPRECP